MEGEMHQDAVHLLGNVRIKFPEVVDAVSKNDVHIILVQPLEKVRLVLIEPVRGDVAPSGDEQQDVSESEEVEPEAAFPVAVVEIEIDPAVPPGPRILDQVVAPDVAVLFVVLMKEPDRLDCPDELVEQRWEVVEEKVLVVPAVRRRLQRELAQRL